MRLLMWIMLASCGRAGFDPLADAEIVGPFGTAIPLAINVSGFSDDDPALTADMLEIIFDSERDDPGGDLYTATRPTLDAPWSSPVRIDELSSGADEDAPCLSPDGLVITFSSNRGGGPGDNDLYASTRPTRDAAWAPPALVAELSTQYFDTRLSQTLDRELAVLQTRASAGAGLYQTRRASAELPWEAPTRLVELNTGSGNADPNIDASGTTIVFSANRLPTSGYAIYIATRATRDEPFSPPEAVLELDTTAAETDPWISPDLRTIVFTRADGGERDIYMATR